MASDQGANSKRPESIGPTASRAGSHAPGRPVTGDPVDASTADAGQVAGGPDKSEVTPAVALAVNSQADALTLSRTTSPMPEEVRELVRLCLEGDQTAMAELVELFRARVFGLCYRMLGHRQDAEDMAQEAFSRALRNLASWDAERDFVPWLLAIAGNRCRSQLAVRMRRPRASSEIAHLPDRTPDSQAERNLTEEVELALAQLRPEYRQAFVLFHEQQLSYADISAAMETPVGTIKTWIHRARRELADFLRERGITQESRDALH